MMDLLYLLYSVLILVGAAALVGCIAAAALKRGRYKDKPRRNFPLHLKSLEKGGE